MATVQDHFVRITPANNFFGHGFYQFTPELFFRIFSAANGFEVERSSFSRIDAGHRGLTS